MKDTGQDFLSVKDLYVEYTSGKKITHALNGLSFSMERGETLGLVGETGAGKTTLAKTVMRILPDPPARIRTGSVLFQGNDLLRLPEKDMLSIRGKKIAMIFQDPMTALNPVRSIGSQIADCYLLHECSSPADARKRAEAMLQDVGIPVIRYDEFPFQFSGGMKQRVVIAMALACNPELILADEPTTALDVTIQAQVLRLMKELKIKFDSSMILITHDLGVVAQTCDRVIVMYAGAAVEEGSKYDIFKAPAHPYTKGLLASLPNMNHRVHRLTPICGLPADPTNLPAGCSFSPRCPHATEQCKSGVIPKVEVSPGHYCTCCNVAKEV